MENKKGISAIVVILIILIVLVAIGIIMVLVVFFTGGENYDDYYSQLEREGKIVNPAANLTVEEAIELFDEDFVYYILYSIKAYNLHDPIFSNNHPKLEFVLEGDVYSASVIKGIIDVSKGGIGEEDIIIYTTKEEAVKMTQNKEYIETSFGEGSSWIETIAGDILLASKGYIDLYEGLTGQSLT